MKRFLAIGLVGLALVVAGTIWAWLQFMPESEAPTPQVASAPPSRAAKPSASSGMKAPPISAPDLPAFDVVRINPAGDAVMAGRAAPNSTVIIHDGDHEIGRVQADGRGEWVFVPNQPLPSGTRELSLTAQGPDGATVKSDKVVVLAVPERGKDLAGQTTGEAGQSLAVAVPRSGPGGSRILQIPSLRGTTDGNRLALETIDYGDEGHVVLSGRASPGAQVQIYLDNRLIGRAIADAEGVWTLAPKQPVPPGTYTIRIDQLGADGRVVARVEMPFVRSAGNRQLASGEAQIVVQPGNSLWRIARRTYGEGTRFTLLFEANKEQIKDPDLIYPGQLFVVPKVN